MAPTLKQSVTSSLVAAGFKSYEDHVPYYATRGTFEVEAGVGAVIRVQWWDSSEDERALLLERIRVALESAGFEIEERERGLYVPQG